jgi:hypothetical protein
MQGREDEKIVFGMKGTECEEFQFHEHQLGVLDTKANNVLMVDSVLIVITTLTSLFQPGVASAVKEMATIATVPVLISVAFCIRVIWVTWATDPSKKELRLTKEEIIRLRNSKTKFLHASLIVLFASLIFYMAALLLFGLR